MVFDLGFGVLEFRGADLGFGYFGFRGFGFSEVKPLKELLPRDPKTPSIRNMLQTMSRIRLEFQAYCRIMRLESG